LRIDWLDNIFSALMRTTRNTVNVIYDDFLKSNDQELGIQSYGAGVDILVEYFKDRLPEEITDSEEVTDD